MALFSTDPFLTLRSKAGTPTSLLPPNPSLLQPIALSLRGQGILSLPRHLSNLLLSLIPLYSACGLQWFYVHVTWGNPTHLSSLLAQHSFRFLLDPSHSSTSNDVPPCSTYTLLSALYSPNAQLSEGLDTQCSDNSVLREFEGLGWGQRLPYGGH